MITVTESNFLLNGLQVSKHVSHAAQLCLCLPVKPNDRDICKESDSEMLTKRKVNAALGLTEKYTSNQKDLNRTKECVFAIDKN